MPNYLYTCRACDIRSLVEASIQHPHQVPTCPSCSAVMVRQYEFGAVRFEGSGFYSTDKDKK